MIGGIMYLVQYRVDSGEYEKGSNACQMCRKIIINAGIKEFVVRIDDNNYNIINVEDWIKEDELLQAKITY